VAHSKSRDLKCGDSKPEIYLILKSPLVTINIPSVINLIYLLYNYNHMITLCHKHLIYLIYNYNHMITLCHKHLIYLIYNYNHMITLCHKHLIYLLYNHNYTKLLILIYLYIYTQLFHINIILHFFFYK